MYAFWTSSSPAKAAIRANKVDLGRWKFVMIASTTLKSYGGDMNSFVSPVWGVRFRCFAIVSRVLTVVVPTAMMRLFFAMASLMILAFFSSSEYVSLCMSWSARLSAVTGLNVPAPTWRVTYASWAPFCFIFSRSWSVKWRPAVGAAMAPVWRAYTV